MATVLDLGLVQYFDSIYAVVFVFALTFAILHKSGLSKSVGLNAVVAVMVSFMTLLSPSVIKIINFMIPWVVVLIIFIVLLLLVFQIFGAGEKDFLKALQRTDNAIIWAVLGIFIVIVVAAFANVLGQSLLEQKVGVDNVIEGEVSSGDFQENIYATIFHPKVLGLLVLFGIAIFAVILLTSSPVS